MQCERSQKHKSVVQSVQIKGNDEKSKSVCSDCVNRLELQNPFIDTPQIFAKMIVDLLRKRIAIKSNEIYFSTDITRCKGCGLSWSESEHTERLGCLQCFHKQDAYLNSQMYQSINWNIQIGQKPTELPNVPQPIMRKLIAEWGSRRYLN